MSENITEYRVVKAKPRSKKLRPRVDLTAMISISFLLIMFFMVNTELSRPQAMDLGLPDYGGCGGNVGCGADFRRTITLLLDDNNKVISYRGLLEVPEDAPKTSGYGKDGIRKELLSMNEKVKGYMLERSYFKHNDGAVVIIKPSKKSNYGNLVDILDEMAINRIPTYAIVNDFTPDEMKLLASK